MNNDDGYSILHVFMHVVISLCNPSDLSGSIVTLVQLVYIINLYALTAHFNSSPGRRFKGIGQWKSRRKRKKNNNRRYMFTLASVLG